MSNIKTGSSYTFDSFEVTKANSKAYEKAKQFAQNADSKPLAIFGGTATGKTHEFDEWFQKFCEGYQRSKRRMRRLHWRFD